MAQEENEIELMDDIEFVDDTIDVDNDLKDDKNKDTSIDEDQIDIDEIKDTESDDDDLDDDDNKSDKDTRKSSNKDSTNTLIPFAKTLKEEGVLSDLNFQDEEGNDIEITGELLVEAVRKQIKENEFSDLKEDEKNILELMRNGGNVKDYLELYQNGKDNGTNFAEINEDNAEDFTRTLLQLEGLSKSRIEDIIDDRTINGTLVSKAQADKPNYDQLLDQSKKTKVEAAKEQQKNQEKELNDNVKKFQDFVSSTESLIEGVKITPQKREKLFKLSTDAVGKDNNGNPQTAFQKAYSEDPYKVELFLNHMLDLTDNFKNLKNISYTKASKSKALEELNTKLAQEKQGVNSNKIGSNNTNNNNKPNILSAIDMFAKR